MYIVNIKASSSASIDLNFHIICCTLFLVVVFRLVFFLHILFNLSTLILCVSTFLFFVSIFSLIYLLMPTLFILCFVIPRIYCSTLISVVRIFYLVVFISVHIYFSYVTRLTIVLYIFTLLSMLL